MDSFSHRSWAGWYGKSMDVTLNMGGKTSYHSVTLTANVKKRDWIFNPQQIIVKVSKDGEIFKEIARMNYPVEGKNEPDAIKEYTLNFQETDAPYLRVIAVPVRQIPEWHNGKGQKSFIFVDEIAVH